MSTNIYDKFLTCACYTLLFSHSNDDDTKGGNKCNTYGANVFYRECTCYETCYQCNMVFYGTSSKYVTNNFTTQCVCNQTCYQEERICACNTTCHLEERGCGCHQARHGCVGNEKCNCNEACDGYSACNCDGGKYEDLCRQCHISTYDVNSPAYNCPCDIECYSYTKPGCNCDAVNHIVNYPQLCNIYTAEDECGQLYSNNVNFNYIESRYY